MSNVFHIIPHSMSISVVLGFLVALTLFIGPRLRDASGWAFVGFLVVMLGLTAQFGYFLYSSRYTTFTLSKEGLVVSHTMYGRSVPASDIKTEDVKVLDLTRDTAYQGGVRTNGLALPNYNLGWFILWNGEEALLFVTDPHKIVYIPTRSGFSILLSTPSPETFIRALQDTIPTGNKASSQIN